MKAKKTILDTIGSTPMVRINALSPNPKVKIFAKLEGFNPTGSIKDRIAVKMIETAEREGRLTKGKTIIEPTSGNTGIGLAIVGIVKGYPVEIVMSEAVSIERRKIIRAYGGTVRLTPAAEGTDGAIRLARKLVAENPDKYFMPDQVRQCRQLLGALRKHGAGDLAADGRTDRLSCLRDRNVGDPDGAVALSESDESRDQGGLRPADQGALYSGSQEYGGGDRARYLRPFEDRRAGIGRERGGDRHGPQDHLRRGYLRRDEQRRRHAGPPYVPQRVSSRGISSSYFPTVPKSTSARRCSGSLRIEARQARAWGR